MLNELFEPYPCFGAECNIGQIHSVVEDYVQTALIAKMLLLQFWAGGISGGAHQWQTQRELASALCGDSRLYNIVGVIDPSCLGQGV